MVSNYPPIILSSGSLHYWHLTLPRIRDLERELLENLASPMAVDGIEIHATLPELYMWEEQLNKGRISLPRPLGSISPTLTRHIITLNNSVHLPPISTLPFDQIFKFANSINTIHRSLGIKNFTLHIDDLNPKVLWKLCEKVDTGVVISIENSDSNKSNGAHPQELALLLSTFPRLGITFDICHWLEGGFNKVGDEDELASFIEEYNNRITQIHFSVPTSSARWYREDSEVKTSHFLAFQSGEQAGQQLAKKIKNTVPWVIEGVIPPRRFHLLERERCLIYDLYSTMHTRISA